MLIVCDLCAGVHVEAEDKFWELVLRSRLGETGSVLFCSAGGLCPHLPSQVGMPRLQVLTFTEPSVAHKSLCHDLYSDEANALMALPIMTLVGEC